MAYAVEFSRRAERELASLSEEARARVVRAIYGMADDPRAALNTKKLVGVTGYRPSRG